MKKTELFTLLTIALVAGPALADDGFRLGAGVNYSTGDYGSDITTEIISVPVTARYDHGDWSFRASLPWISISGDPNVLPGTGPVNNLNPIGRGRPLLPGPPGGGGGDVGEASGSASGIGDLTLRAVYAVPTAGAVGVDLSLFAKIATADEAKGLGTGENDYGLAVDLHGQVGTTTLFGGLSYTSLGDSDFIDTDDVFGANLGAAWALGAGQLGVVYDWRQAASSRFNDRSELTGFYSVRQRDGSQWQFYLLRGLSDGSPEWGGGINYTHAF
ncbi:MAG: transporter [Lysobacteraceae bacterium]